MDELGAPEHHQVVRLFVLAGAAADDDLLAAVEMRFGRLLDHRR